MPRTTNKLEDESTVEFQDKLGKLNDLLEKAGAYASFLYSNLSTSETRVKENQSPARKKQKNHPKASSPPRTLTGGTLRPYQLDGIRWLCNLYENGLNGILADEMGLGKTIQVLGFFAQLRELGITGPFLVVAPLSTLHNWATEMAKWTPTYSCLLYHGTTTERKELRQRYARDQHSVVITSYQMIIQDAGKFFNKWTWKYLVVDEGHRLKNRKCLLIEKLMKMRTENRLLLTGTPLQNELCELWSLLHFLLPTIFDNLELFESWFQLDEESSTFAENDENDENDENEAAQTVADKLLSAQQKANIINQLHAVLRPFVLRRLKSHAVTDLPKKIEVVVYVPMSACQREMYRLIVKNEFHQAMIARHGHDGVGHLGRHQTKLRNRVMQLRKCCNHPFLLDEPSDQTAFEHSLVRDCGKFRVLLEMLSRLHERGHRVLIFSQMTKVLDLMESLLSVHDWEWCRIDGSTPLPERVNEMRRYNEAKEKNPNLFCFLLSTRAAGLGINLVSADTVIFYDSDWNPQQDLQAQDRCHRIGQTKPVMVYRLISAKSVENHLLDRANQKRKLDRVIIQRGNFKQGGVRLEKEVSAVELEKLLKDDIEIREKTMSSSVAEKTITSTELDYILDREHFINEANEYCPEARTSGQGYQCVDVTRAANQEM